MTPPTDVVIHWFRRDLRLHDNTALLKAAGSGARVIPVYILSEWKGRHLWPGPARQHFLCESLQSLASDLESRCKGRLVFRSGTAEQELEKLITETGASAVYYNRDPDPAGKAVEQRVNLMCQRLGVRAEGSDDVSLLGPDQVLTQQAEPYRVFTPYSKRWLGLEKPPVQPEPGPLHTPAEIQSISFSGLSHWRIENTSETLTGGEQAARKRLSSFLSGGIATYASLRDFPARGGTSRLSQDLRFGLLSPRTVFHEAAAVQEAAASSPAKESAATFIKELAWREFYIAILKHYPEVLELEFNTEWRGLPWDEPGSRFTAWKEGLTGFPIVDAGIREMLATGFMHNRVRMIVAMFLTKDLHIDWRLGEQFFMQNLVDGEIASNNGGWQWSAGVGADAAPYFRIQNPWTQTKRYDPDGEYIRRWVPELNSTDARKLAEAPAAGLSVTRGYPAPCVDHAKERDRTLEIFKRHRMRQR